MAEFREQAKAIIDQRIDDVGKELNIQRNQVERAITQRPFVAVAFASAGAFVAGAMFASMAMRKAK